MKILIPNYIPDSLVKQLKQIAADAEILRLEVESHENFLRKGLRHVASRIFPYALYKQYEQFYKSKKKYRILVDGKPLDQALTGVEVFFVNWEINRDVFTAIVQYLPDLQWVHSWKTGFDHLNLNVLKERKITLTHSYAVHSQRIAEFTLGCVMDVTKHISQHIDLKKQRKWAQIQSTELKGQTIGILGTGTLGSEVARLAKGLKMRTVGFNRTHNPNEHFEKIVGTDQIQKIFPELDYLVICLPLTDATRELIGLNELLALKNSAYVINIGRSEIVKEADLIQVLKEGKIAGAILDVYHHEMQLANHPYYRLDNVILTHYSAHSSDKSNQEIFNQFLDNFTRFQAKKELTNVVSGD